MVGSVSFWRLAELRPTGRRRARVALTLSNRPAQFVPRVHVLYGMAFPTRAASLVRFEAQGEPGSASVSLSQIALTCLELTGSDVVGIVLAGETEGLVGAALRQSPAVIPKGVDPFDHPDVRDWVSLTPEPEHRQSTALVVGVAARA